MKRSTTIPALNSRSSFGPFSRPGGIDSIFADVDSLSGDVPLPVDVLAGFDAVIQFSRDLLQAAMAQSLNAKGLATLGAQVPWDAGTAPPLLRAAVASLFKYGGGRLLGEHRLEVRLVRPYLQELRWPDLPPDQPVPPVVSGRSAASTTTALQARARHVDVGWQFEVNILVAGLPTTAGEVSVSQPSVPPSGGPTGLGPTSVGPTSVGPSGGAPVDGRSWRRILMGQGQAVTAAVANTVVTPTLLRFGMGLDFTGEAPPVSSDDPMVTEFVATSLCHDLLAQAVAPLLSASAINLTPTIGPAGSLSTSQVQSLNLPPMNVHDALLTDPRGAPVLCLCVDIGSTSQGVLRLVQPILEAADFAYGVSMNLLGPALKARWRALATGLSFIRDVPVELRVSEDSEETATGRARVQVRFSDALNEATIRPSETNAGDPLRLLSEPTITLLGLWDHQGQQFTDLGPLADPQTAPFPLILNVFDGAPPNGQGNVDPTFEVFIGKLLMITAYPVLEGFRVGNIAGVTSSATQSVVARWRLRTAWDDIRPTGPKNVGGISP